MKKKIEIDILFFVLCEACFLLFFFKKSMLTTILGIILGIVLILITKSIKNNKIFKIPLIISTIIICPITLYKIVLFIQDNILQNYSFYLIIITFLILSFYLIKKNYHTYIKALEISFYIFIFFKILSFILIIPKININNFIIFKDLDYSYSFIIIGIVILYLYQAISFLTNYYIEKKRTIISLINPLLMKLITTLVLGNTLLNIYKYPYVNYVKTIRYFDFIERIDGLLSFEYLISFFYLFNFFLLIIKSSLKSLTSYRLTTKS